MALTKADAWHGPAAFDPGADWIAAPVPGTVAGALRDAGRAPVSVHAHDAWYRAPLRGEGRERLVFAGLATIAEVWIDGVLVLSTRSMFAAHSVEVALTPRSEIAICFRSLADELRRPHRRGRWRPRLATPGSLRHVRTTLLGFMPGWCPPVEGAGPFRPVTREPLAGAITADLRAELDGTTGRLVARLRTDGGAGGVVRLYCNGEECVLLEAAPGQFEGVLELPDIAPWWPHTHGEPRLHPVEAVINGRRFDLGHVGFRTLAVTRPFAEGLALSVNGVPVFCRGATWTPADLVGLSGEPETYRPLLTLARNAGMNMLRVSGITLYEADAFHDLCDEMGIMVWQDAMLANFDYPHDDPLFRDALHGEIAQLLDRLQTSPSLCVLCGGSEVWQQAAMLGGPVEVWRDRFGGETLGGLAAASRPDLVVVPNSPSGGDLPFHVRAGVAHYYGVGAYLRPLEDARRAAVGFASECLAFANVPEPALLARNGLADPNTEAWSAGVPRDRGAEWDFEDVREHYQRLLYGSDPAELKRGDPERYLALGRATVAEVMEETIAEWRRPGSPTAGALVWLLRDLAPGAGWGVIDSDNRPKSAWYALKRAFRPRQVSFSDEGLDGLHVHVRNETPAPFEARLRLAFSDSEGGTVAAAERVVRLDAREARSWSSTELLGRFFDATAAYRFGPPAHCLGHASLSEDTGEVIAECFHFPQGRDVEQKPIGLAATLAETGESWTLEIGTERYAHGVHIETEDGRTLPDNWFHLAPGGRRPLVVGGKAPRRGTVTALNGTEVARFGTDDA
ncbi:glycosyl hydrolase 2 galactose-binding domain-containing protein [Aureimonas psammosilenae]|uniref:glycosyl hydrolase 2 galactose-binding domain-containing protein n=1 Tax=Aureimonas psammosilenae TaxID=2495496 RepID=UPI001F45EDCA|nr:glycoside hydrolase family 2 protein [Aureimonas psammosilenae]